MLIEKTKTYPWSLETSMESDDERLALLEVAIEENHPELIAEAIGIIARKRGMTDLAKATGLGRESLYKALSKQGDPKISTLVKVLKALGLRIAIVPDTEATQDNEKAAGEPAA